MVVLRADRIKCVVLGDDKVGKTSLLMNYATNRFPSKHVPHLFDNYAGSIDLLGKQYTLQMIDTLDEGESDEARRHSYPGTEAFVICFSVVKPDSFQSVQKRWIPEVRNQMGDTPFILVGTQADLRDDDSGESDEARRHSYPGTDAFVICFSVVKPDSFQSVQKRWIPEVRNQMGDTPFILVGTQADLRDDDSVIQNLALQGKRPITSREAASICRRLGAACYIECSPIMKKRIRRVMNDALVSVFCPKDDIISVPCVLL